MWFVVIVYIIGVKRYLPESNISLYISTQLTPCLGALVYCAHPIICIIRHAIFRKKIAQMFCNKKIGATVGVYLLFIFHLYYQVTPLNSAEHLATTNNYFNTLKNYFEDEASKREKKRKHKEIPRLDVYETKNL
jgi:hypothetical protein